MANLGNTELHFYFENYHAAIKNEILRIPGEKVLVVKCLLEEKELQILIQPSYTIFDVKLSIEHAYGREIYLLEQQELICNDICLKDKQTMTKTMVYENGSIFLIVSGSMEIEEHEQEAKKVKIKDITKPSESKLT